MFYGGRLLSHLSANDEEVDEFISLRRLNRNVAILIDSDKRAARTPLNATKQRVARELGDSFAWVTKGREIENYVPESLLSGALRDLYPKFESVLAVGQYDQRLPFRQSDGATVSDVDKVKVARRVVEHPADFTELDLRKKVEALVEFIRRAGHPVR